MSFQHRVASIILIAVILAIIVLLLITAHHNVEHNENNLEDVQKDTLNTNEAVKYYINDSNNIANCDIKENNKNIKRLKGINISLI